MTAELCVCAAEVLLRRAFNLTLAREIQTLAWKSKGTGRFFLYPAVAFCIGPVTPALFPGTGRPL